MKKQIIAFSIFTALFAIHSYSQTNQVAKFNSTTMPSGLTQSIVFDNGVNVGIGTTTPQRKLDLSNTGQLTFGDDVITNSTNGIYWHSGSAYSLARTSGAWSGPYYQQLLMQFATGIIIDGGSVYGKSGTVLQPNGGNVGIGTTIPSNKLDIVGGATRTGTHATTRALYVTGTFNANSNGVEFRQYNGTQGIGFGYNTIYATGSDASQDLGLQSLGASGNLNFTTNATPRMIILGTNGNVGIGITSPSTRLQVQAGTPTSIVQILSRGTQGISLPEEPTLPITFGTPYLQIGGIEYRANSKQTIGFGYHNNTNFQPCEIGFLTTNTTDNTLGDIVFANRNVTTNTAPVEVMRITSSGIVGIGTATPNAQYKLSVKGAIRCEKVVVEIGWADYVFNKEYKLMPINELENFVSANNHLPNIPSAKEVEKEGLDLGSVQAKQMEKIEELTLYIIEMNKKIQEQNQRIADLEKIAAKK